MHSKWICSFDLNEFFSLIWYYFWKPFLLSFFIQFLFININKTATNKHENLKQKKKSQFHTHDFCFFFLLKNTHNYIMKFHWAFKYMFECLNNRMIFVGEKKIIAKMSCFCLRWIHFFDLVFRFLVMWVKIDFLSRFWIRFIHDEYFGYSGYHFR